MKKCVARCEQLLKAGSSVVVDNTNVTAASREPFLKTTKSLEVPTYACVMQTSLDHCRHNEMVCWSDGTLLTSLFFFNLKSVCKRSNYRDQEKWCLEMLFFAHPVCFTRLKPVVWRINNRDHNPIWLIPGWNHPEVVDNTIYANLPPSALEEKLWKSSRNSSWWIKCISREEMLAALHYPSYLLPVPFTFAKSYGVDSG